MLPTAHTSFEAVPQTAVNVVGQDRPVGTLVHALPFQCSAIAFPTAQTSLALAPQTPIRSEEVPLATAVQAVPFQCKIVPAEPTAQMSLAVVPQIPARLNEPWNAMDHPVPFECKMVLAPTAHTSPGAAVQTLAR